MTKVFLNYRSVDNPWGAAVIHEWLARRFGADRVFRDCVSLEAGEHYPSAIRAALDKAELLIAVIGPRWSSATDPDTGERLIDRKTDWVRLELAWAFDRNIPVLPVLLRDTPEDGRLPKPAELPTDIRRLATVQAFPVSQRRLNADLERLSERLSGLCPALAPDVLRSAQSVRAKPLATRAAGAVTLVAVLLSAAASSNEPPSGTGPSTSEPTTTHPGAGNGGSGRGDGGQTAGGAGDGQTGGSSGTDRTEVATPTWGYASTHFYQYNEPIGHEIDLHRQWQWGTWRLSGDPALAGRYATMIRTDTGRYQVRLPGLAGTVGVPHVEIAAGTAQESASCQIADSRVEGVDRMADIACFDPSGTPKNLPFVVVYNGNGNGPSPWVTARYDGASVSGVGHPLTVRHTGAGQYTVDIPGPFTGRGFARVTPVGVRPARCRPVELGPTGTNLRIQIECDAPGGLPLDTGWTISYTEDAGLQHDSRVPAAYLTTAGDPSAPVIATDRSWSSDGETPIVTRTGPGAYDLWYQRIGKPLIYPADAVVVTAIGGQPRYCRIEAWNSSMPPKVRILVWCFDLTGHPADATFALAYLRN